MHAQMANVEDDIGQLVAALQEVYQPIYGHPQFSADARRSSDDRLVSIASIYRVLEEKLKRPLRVLDLGCAQGYFSFSLAALGADVFGIDFSADNIALCKALAKKNPDLKARFEQDLIENVITGLEEGRFDFVLGLSVFHHLVRRYGIGDTQKVLGILADKTVAGVYEMALAVEPVSWGPLQPKNARDLMRDYAFVHEFARFQHHMSDVWRPMYVASNRYWFLNGQGEAFQTWKNGSHTGASDDNRKTRRYFFGHGHMAKLLLLDNEKMRAANLQECDGEAAFLSNPPDGFDAPRLFLYGHHQNEAWLVRECPPGELLCDMIVSGKPYDAKRIIGDVLRQLAVLESQDLTHNDLRPANILIAPDGSARIIDFGSITRDKKARDWPHDLFLSCMICITEILHGKITISNTERSSAFNPENFPEPYRRIFWQLYMHEPEAWRFQFLHDHLWPEEDPAPASVIAQGSLIAVMQAMESACRIYQDAAVRLLAQQGNTVSDSISEPRSRPPAK